MPVSLQGERRPSHDAEHHIRRKPRVHLFEDIEIDFHNRHRNIARLSLRQPDGVALPRGVTGRRLPSLPLRAPQPYPNPFTEGSSASLQTRPELLRAASISAHVTPATLSRHGDVSSPAEDTGAPRMPRKGSGPGTLSPGAVLGALAATRGIRTNVPQ